MSKILETQGVCKYFGGLKAVEDVSLALKKGQILGLIGPNGAGKTTFQNCIAGTYPPTSGQVILDGKDITGLNANHCCHFGLARTYQIVKFFPQMTVLENVMVGSVFGKSHQKPNARKIAIKMLDFVEFPMGHDVIAENLNTVQLKRLELARALATDCKLLFLDEVAAGLTPSELVDITSLILRIRGNGTSILIVEHLMKLIMNVCDQIVVLNFGRKIADGTPGEISEDPVVSKAYLGANTKL